MSMNVRLKCLVVVVDGAYFVVDNCSAEVLSLKADYCDNLMSEVITLRRLFIQGVSIELE